MKKTVVSMGVLALFVSLATGVRAYKKPPEQSIPAIGPINILVKLDADGDGIITREEVQQSQAAKFGEMDSDKNGEASTNEIETSIRGLLEPGRIKKRNSFLVRWDVNKDGVITTAEIDATMKKGIDRRAKKIRSKYLKTLDMDRNGSLSQEEYLEKRLPPFERADTNDDDKVTMVELKALADTFVKARRSGSFKAFKKSVAREMNK